MKKLTKSDRQILDTWRTAEAAAKAAWKEVLAAGLYYQSIGVDVEAVDSAWRTPPTVTVQGQQFYQGLHGRPQGSASLTLLKTKSGNGSKPKAKAAEIDDDDLC